MQGDAFNTLPQAPARRGRLEDAAKSVGAVGPADGGTSAQAFDRHNIAIHAHLHVHYPDHEQCALPDFFTLA